MGSWNDQWFTKADVQARYEAVTSSLRKAVFGGILAAVNEPFQ